MSSVASMQRMGWKVLVVTGCAALAACTSGLKIDGRDPQWEARYVLKTLLTDKQRTFAAQHRYDPTLESLSIQPEYKNRYLYVLSASGPSQDRTQPSDGGLHTILLADPRANSRPDNARILAGVAPDVRALAGVDGVCPACELTIVAAGNLDEDATIDVWSISTKARTLNGEAVAAGVPFNHVNDRER